jgi:hypothetical protein
MRSHLATLAPSQGGARWMALTIIASIAVGIFVALIAESIS